MNNNLTHKINQKKTVALFFVFVFGYLIILILLIGVLYFSTEKRVKSEIKSEERYTCLKTSDITNEIVRQIKSDVLFLTRQTKSFSEQSKYEFEKHLVETFYEFALSKETYNQIRYIDVSGKEKVRINYSEGKAEIVEKKKLQDKSKRYYFQEIKRLPQDSVFFSPMDLNVEKDAIEIPFKPMIRIGSPVFNRQQELTGMVVANFFGDIIIDKLISEDESNNGEILFLNKNGYYFIGLEKDVEWGFMFDEKKDKTFFYDFPEESKMVYEGQEGTFSTAKGMFTFATVNPLSKELMDEDKKGPNFLQWKLISFVPAKELNLIILNEVKSWWFIFVFMSLIFVTLFWFLSRNINLKIEARRQLVERNKELSYANATKDKFFSIIAHDLKSPFAGLLGLSEVLAENAANLSEEKLNSVTRSVFTTAKNIFVLLENLLQWARLQTDKLAVSLEEVNMNEMLFETVDLLQKTASQKQITLTNEIPDGLKIYADDEMIKTVFRNIISNAVKFTSAGGEIKLSASAKSDDKWVEVKIQDNGVGMDKEQLKNLFRIGKVKSKPGTANEKGTGLGLILCKEFIDLNNGKLTVESEPGKGTLFSVFLPVAPHRK
ncbi:sensor histidine kinase [Maribellus maritimus]|uniref:sensor histidine kinase n=1 Tax=Maribellus maritimus TaxID=2870838 RepID=UPI001EEAADF3|nr:ATP-binding protein [Maribellus maritimus]MCG6186388.1 sensor histidine kinase [Maribellus maritimus]